VEEVPENVQQEIRRLGYKELIGMLTVLATIVYAGYLTGTEITGLKGEVAVVGSRVDRNTESITRVATQAAKDQGSIVKQIDKQTEAMEVIRKETREDFQRLFQEIRSINNNYSKEK